MGPPPSALRLLDGLPLAFLFKQTQDTSRDARRWRLLHLSLASLRLSVAARRPSVFALARHPSHEVAAAEDSARETL